MAAPNAPPLKQLRRPIGTARPPSRMDGRREDDLENDPCLIPGAIRHPRDDMDRSQERRTGKVDIAICHKSKKPVVWWLQPTNQKVENLQRGTCNWREMPQARCVRLAAVPTPRGGRTRWITRHRSMIHHAACPRLIVPNDVTRFEATLFEVGRVLRSHRATSCTFDTVLNELRLRIPGLDRLAKAIHAADINQHILAPGTAGLLVDSVCQSHKYQNDNNWLEVIFKIDKALCHWTLETVNEGHDWPKDQR